MSGERNLPGLDLGLLERHLAARGLDVDEGDLSARLIAGGRSNLTYAVSDKWHDWVLRRPPLSHVLASAHDMGREFRVISALTPTDLPVPPPVLSCEDPEVLGAPFYLMERVEGVPYRLAAQLEPLGEARTRAITERMVDTLADLHRIDPEAVGLAGFGRPTGFLERQVRVWKRQLDGSRTRNLAHAHELHDLLVAHVPPTSRASIVHGDYRLDNLLIDDSDSVTAVLDWEMATLGDPLTDVALMMVYQEVAGWPRGGLLGDAPNAPGYLTADEIFERYAARAAVDAPSISFYMALAYFKLGAIIEGIHCRAVQGGTATPASDDLGDLVVPLFAAGRRILDQGRARVP